MAIVLHNIKSMVDAGEYELDISVDGLRSTFTAVMTSDGGGGACDEKLFFLLSKRALLECGSSAQYHADLLLLVRDVQQGKALGLPFIFGTERRFKSALVTGQRPWWHRLVFWSSRSANR